MGVRRLQNMSFDEILDLTTEVFKKTKHAISLSFPGGGIDTCYDIIEVALFWLERFLKGGGGAP